MFYKTQLPLYCNSILRSMSLPSRPLENAMSAHVRPEDSNSRGSSGPLTGRPAGRQRTSTWIVSRVMSARPESNPVSRGFRPGPARSGPRHSLNTGFGSPREIFRLLTRPRPAREIFRLANPTRAGPREFQIVKPGPSRPMRDFHPRLGPRAAGRPAKTPPCFWITCNVYPVQSVVVELAVVLRTGTPTLMGFSFSYFPT